MAAAAAPSSGRPQAVDLPVDCVRLIFSHLGSLRDKAACCLVCRSWEALLREATEELWGSVQVDTHLLSKHNGGRPMIGDPPGGRRHAASSFFERRGSGVRVLSVAPGPPRDGATKAEQQEQQQQQQCVSVHPALQAAQQSPRLPGQRSASNMPVGVVEFLRSNLASMGHLTKLILDRCPASAVGCIASCVTLEELCISRLVFEAEAMSFAVLMDDAPCSRVTAVLAPLARLRRLRSLRVSAYRTADDCILVTSCGPLPAFLPELPALERLALPNISSVPAAPRALPCGTLRELSLLDCLLPYFPEAAVISCSRLESLAIDFAVQLDAADISVPQGVEALAGTLRSVELCHVPSHLRHLGSLAGLTRLALHECSLFAWPAWCEGLPRLRSLSLQDNSIAYVPRSVSRLAALEELDVSCNGCRLTLPTTLSGMAQHGALTSLVWGPGLHAEEMEVFLETRQGCSVRVGCTATMGRAWRLAGGAPLESLPLSTLAECCGTACVLGRVARERMVGDSEAARGAAVMVLT